MFAPQGLRRRVMFAAFCRFITAMMRPVESRGAWPWACGSYFHMISVQSHTTCDGTMNPISAAAVGSRIR